MFPLISFKFVNICRYGSLIAVVSIFVLSSPRSVHCLIILYAFPASSRLFLYTQSNGRYYNTINDNHWYITHSLTNTLTEFMGFNSKIHMLYAFNRNHMGFRMSIIYIYKPYLELMFIITGETICFNGNVALICLHHN